MVNHTDVHKVSGHLPVSLAHFGDSSDAPLLLPINLLEVQTEPALTKCLLSLVLKFALQFHVFRICAEWIFRDSSEVLRMLNKDPENCP